MMATKASIKVAVLHPSLLYREGLKALVEKDNQLKVIYDGPLSFDSLQNIQQKRIDVMILPLSIPSLLFDLTIGFINGYKHSMPILVLVDNEKEQRIINALKTGVHGYIHTSSEGKHLIKAVKTVMNGQFWTERGLIKSLLKKVQFDSSIIHFSKQQKIIGILLVEGKADKEIARQLHISIPTVRYHVYSLYKKLGVTTRVQAMSKLLREIYPYHF
jgi:DNA-binding NarL/FixJ family response regulator